MPLTAFVTTLQPSPRPTHTPPSTPGQQGKEASALRQHSERPLLESIHTEMGDSTCVVSCVLDLTLCRKSERHMDSMLGFIVNGWQCLLICIVPRIAVPTFVLLYHLLGDFSSFYEPPCPRPQSARKQLLLWSTAHVLAFNRKTDKAVSEGCNLSTDIMTCSCVTKNHRHIEEF